MRGRGVTGIELQTNSTTSARKARERIGEFFRVPGNATVGDATAFWRCTVKIEIDQFSNDGGNVVIHISFLAICRAILLGRTLIVIRKHNKGAAAYFG